MSAHHAHIIELFDSDVGRKLSLRVGEVWQALRRCHCYVSKVTVRKGLEELVDMKFLIKRQSRRKTRVAIQYRRNPAQIVEDSSKTARKATL